MILDFGCGCGRKWMRNAEDVVGIDVSLPRITEAKSRISVAQCDGRFLPFRDSVFQLVVTDSVLEHVPDYGRALSEIRRVLASDGRCRILQPVDNDPIFFVARRVARKWNGDKIYSRFSSGRLLNLLSSSFGVVSVKYVPNSPIAGVLGFFNRKAHRHLQKLDRFYSLACSTTGLFHWEVIIEATK